MGTGRTLAGSARAGPCDSRPPSLAAKAMMMAHVAQPRAQSRASCLLDTHQTSSLSWLSHTGHSASLPRGAWDLLGSLEVMEAKAEASEVPGEEGSQGRKGSQERSRGKYGASDGGTAAASVDVSAAAAAAPNGKRFLWQRAPRNKCSALPPPSRERCSPLQCNSSKHARKEITTAREEEGLPFCKVGTTCSQFLSEPLSLASSQALQRVTTALGTAGAMCSGFNTRHLIYFFF